MTIKKEIVDTLKISIDDEKFYASKQDIIKQIENLKGLMNTAAGSLDFETAIKMREEIAKLKKKLK